MKKIISVLFFLFCANLIFAQSALDSLYKAGIKLHDEGKYEKAIELYKQALKIKPDDPALNYEIAFSYFKMQDFDKCLIYSDKALEDKNAGKENKIRAILTKGSALDYLGRRKESIELFEDCIKNYGPDYLVYYNLGVDYYNTINYAKAEESFLNAINQKKDHAGSHYMLGYVMRDTHRKLNAMMCMYYFLYLEPESERSKDAYKQLNKLHNNLFKKNENGVGTTIYMETEANESTTTDFLYAMQKVLEMKDYDSTKTKTEIFFDNTKSLFSFLNNIKTLQLKAVWKDVYAPFFSDLVTADFVDVFSYYVSVSSSKSAMDWLENHTEKFKKFDAWLTEKGY
ncbi:MAG: tetratricopeptide repeat protein [Ignavibacteria bacterium]|nr:tetratricopeptide repeat protein [Ignavibacteria bacterium]